MNLTHEQKTRVFALYLGLPCRVVDLDGQTFFDKIESVIMDKAGARISIYEFGDIDFTHIDEYCQSLQLLLKPLSAITDEDAIEAGSLHDRYLKIDLNLNHFISLIKSRVRSWAKSDYQVFQYLIQQGYAVPLFIAPGHPDNGKDAIQLGIAIDINSIKL
jgi:hypothetical protein